MESINSVDQFQILGSEILREAEKGEESIFEIFKKLVVSKINYSDEKKVGTFTPPEVFEIASSTLNHNYQQPDFVFGIIVIYNALDLNQSNVVEKLEPFLSGPAITDKKGGILRNRLKRESLVMAEDYLGLKRDTLYKPFSDENWMNKQEHLNRSKGIPPVHP